MAGPAPTRADVPTDGTLVGLGMVAAVGAAAAVATSTGAVSWTCPWLAVTGFFCPFCGSTRMVLAVVDGDLAAAASYNAPVLVLGAILAVLWTTWTLRRLGVLPQLPALPGPRARRWILGTVAALAIAFTIARNLPWPPFVALAP